MYIHTSEIIIINSAVASGCTALSLTATDDDNRIALGALPSELMGEDEDSDYVNAYVGDYINASYIDVSPTRVSGTVCVLILLWASLSVCVFIHAGLFETKAIHSLSRYSAQTYACIYLSILLLALCLFYC